MPIIKQEVKERIIAMKKAGMSHLDVSLELGVSCDTVGKYAKLAGITYKNRRYPWDEEKIDSMMAWLDAGKSYSYIARKLGCTKPTVYNKVKEQERNDR